MDYAWLIIALASGSASNLFSKAGMLRVGKSPQNLGKLPRFLLRAFSNPLVICGVVLAIVFAVTYSFAMSVFPLSYLYPLSSAMPIVLVVVFSLLLFKEKVSRRSWVGIVTICVGVVLLGIAMG
jgi:multidrug transporter EmrE-like cation transporter